MTGVIEIGSLDTESKKESSRYIEKGRTYREIPINKVLNSKPSKLSLKSEVFSRNSQNDKLTVKS
tara:strand:+ start:70 stop:264 length:195 start_codon:yes stop_codon:yes gene_type:complete